MIQLKQSFLFYIIVFLIGTNNSIAQDEELMNYLYPINTNNNQYFGLGVDWILNKSDSTQFFLFGEQHGIKGIPELASAIFTKLNVDSTYRLALEMDEWTTRKIYEEGLETIASKYPHSIAFDYDSDLELINSVKGKSEIWGLDQMVTAIHPYQRLTELAPNENARRLAQGAYLKAALKMGRYISQPHFDDFKALRNAFGSEISEEANLILNHLKTSMEIYVAYKAGRRGDISRQVTVEMRETFMMRQFDAYINENPKQKVVFKMGGAHTMKGIGPNGVETLGSYTRSIAIKNNLNALHIGLFNYHKDLQFVTTNVFEHSDIVLLDCDAYLKSISDSLFNSFTGSNKLLLKQNDAIILFNNADRAKKVITTPYKNTFKSSLIKKVAIDGILILLCLTMIVPLILFTFSKVNRTSSYKLYSRLLIQLFIVVLVTIALFGFQIDAILKVDDSSTIMNGSLSIWIYATLVLLASFFIYKVIKFLSNTAAKRKHKVYLTIITSSYFCLIMFMYYWNIGGMISF